MKRIVFDSFALLALFRNEPGAAFVKDLLTGLSNHQYEGAWMSAVNLGELYYMTVRKHSESAAQRILDDVSRFPITVVAPDTKTCLLAAVIKSKYKVSYADAFAASLTQQQQATLITGDAEFKNLDHLKGFKVKFIN